MLKSKSELEKLPKDSENIHASNWIKRYASQGKQYKAGYLLNEENIKQIMRLDEGYYIFRSIRNSPPYFEKRKKDVFAMIRQLQLPTWFMSLSSADTKWIYRPSEITEEITRWEALYG